MQNSRFQTIVVPSIGILLLGQNIQPVALAKAAGTPLRVLVRNISAATIFLGESPGDVAGPEGPSTATFQLAAGLDSVFVLAPKQSLYAVASAVDVQVCVSISDAIPVV